MANPRKNVDFKGLNAPSDYVTYKYDSSIVYNSAVDGGSAQIGRAVTITAARTVGLAGDGEKILGRLEIVEPDGFCGIVRGGYVELPAGTGATLTLGGPIVGALLSSAKGYIKAAPTGSVAAGIAGRGQIVDATNTTKVIVDLQ